VKDRDRRHGTTQPFATDTVEGSGARVSGSRHGVPQVDVDMVIVETGQLADCLYDPSAGRERNACWPTKTYEKQRPRVGTGGRLFNPARPT
jgi:hypothetical protein